VRRAALALAVLLAAGPAGAYVRTTSKTTGVALAWPVPVVPWQLNPAWAHTAPSCADAAPLDAAQASFAQWEQGCANIHLPFAGESTQQGIGVSAAGQNVVMFRRGWCSQDPRIVDQSTGAILDPCMNDPDLTCGDKYGCFQDPVACIGQTNCASWGVVALTTVLHDPASGRILAADIELVGWDGTAGPLGSLPPHGWYFTCFPGAQPATICGSYGQDLCVYQDLQNTLTHESGHFIGLAHSPVPGATMNATTQPGETLKRSLSSDDIAGVCAIYPQAAGGCGCGGGEGTGAVSLLAAAALLRRRRGTSVPPLR
jgi:uncharacterized protein (TIGR03382 family)